ncbi:hypothetical protein HDZ31DRAFT_32436 [Schizophyllum fasciatum]
MIPIMQAFANKNRFHTEHEDYGLWSPILSSMIEKHMARPGVVVPQPKLWLLPDNARAQLKRSLKERTKKAGASDMPSATQESSDADAQVMSLATLPSPQSASFEDSLPALGVTNPAINLGAFKTAPTYNDPLLVSTCRFAISFSSFIDPQADGETREILEVYEPLDHEQRLLDQSTSTIRTNKPKGTKKVISDFAVLAPQNECVPAITNARIVSACADVRKEFLRTATDSFPPVNYVPRFVRDEDQSDSDEEYESDDEDPEWVPNQQLRDYMPPPLDFDLRPRRATESSSFDISELGPPGPVSNARYDEGHHDGGDHSTPIFEELDWVGQSVFTGSWWERPRDWVCNYRAAYRGLQPTVKLVVALLLESKRGASRSEPHDKYCEKTWRRFYKGMRSVTIQATYLLTSKAWKHQTQVVALVTVSDFWSWTSFERIAEREVKENWEDYTPETAPIRRLQPWSRPVPWGCSASDCQVKLMMDRVNFIFPGFSNTTTTPATPRDTAAPPPEPPVSGDSSNIARPVVSSEQTTPDVSSGQGDPRFSGDWDNELDYAEDESAFKPSAPNQILSSDRAPTAGMSCHILASVCSLNSDAATPSTIALTGQLWRQLERQETLDTEPDTVLSQSAGNESDDASDADTRRPLHGESTQVALDGLAAIDLGNNVGSTSVAPANNAGGLHATATTIGPVNPRKRSGSPESESDDADRHAKKVRKASLAVDFAKADPSAQSQVSSAPTRGGKATQPRKASFASRHPRNEKGKFVKKTK